MYCYNCGKKLDEKAVICTGCGVAVSDIFKVKKSSSNGLGIAGFVLGILGIVLSSLIFIGLLVILSEGNADFFTNFGDTIFVSFLTIPGVCFSIIAYKKQKNGVNTAGMTLNIISIVLSIIWLFFI